MPKATLTDVLIELHVPNFKPVKEFYSQLGFQVVWERQAHKQNGYLVLKREKTILCFYCGSDQVYQHAYFKRFSQSSPKGYAVEISIPAKNIDRFYCQILKKLDKKYLIEPMVVKPYDLNPKKDFRLKDPFGFYLCFHEPYDIMYKE